MLAALSATIFVAGCAWAALARVGPYVADHDYFRLRSIRISSDETRVTPQTLAEIAGLYDDTSLWRIEPDRVERELGRQSWVREASVSRSFPWQVSLSVEKRRAVAAAVADGRAWLVDEGGVLFREVEDGGAPDLPYLSGWDHGQAQAERSARLQALLGALREARQTAVEVSELHLDDDGALWLYATSFQAPVRVGDPGRIETALGRLRVALDELGPLAERVRLIDTDYPDRIVIRGADDRLPALLAARADHGAAGRPGATGATGEGRDGEGGARRG